MPDARDIEAKAGQVRWFGQRFDPYDCAMAVARIRQRAPQDRFGYVTTPNVDHIVRLLTETTPAEVHLAYDSAEITLCDSQVLALLARLRGARLSVAPGSDVTAALLDAERGTDDPILIVGGDEQTLVGLRERYGLTNVRQHIPPQGLIDDEDALDAAARFIADNPSRYVFIAVGSPQQEIVAYRASQLPEAVGCGLCIGASIDYLTGHRRRAPFLFRRLALEWLFRLICEPRRLWHRYLVRSPRIFRLINRDHDQN